METEKIIHQVLERGNIKEAEDVPGELKRLFAIALEISSEQHIWIQAAFQRHVGNLVFKTISLPQEATVRI
jgi:ribonucleoside-diphosphate reductase alpha chain